MSDPEGFVTRWSRLKRQALKEKDPGKATAVAEGAEGHEGSATAPASAVEGGEPAPFDPTTLPSIESITASSDIRSFLQSGVPAELTKAALRRAWTADPAIRDFIGLAENQWDFTDPTAMPGFGPLEATDDVQKLVAQAMGKLDDVLPPETATASTPAGTQGLGLSHTAAAPKHQTPQDDVLDSKANDAHAIQPEQGQVETASVAPQHKIEGQVVSRRSHGRALPQ